MYFLAEPLAFIIRPIYELIKDYGLTLIVVTLLIKIVTIPLTVKSQKSAIKTQMLQPEIQKIQYKYRNDKNMQAIKMQELYKTHNVSPLGGCLPLILQMFVLFGFIRVIYDPLTHMLQMSAGEIETLMKMVPNEHYQVSVCGYKKVQDAILAMGKPLIDFDFFGINLTQMPKDHIKEWTVWIFPVLATGSTILSSYVSKKQMNDKKKTENKPVTGSNEQAQSMSNSMMTIMPVITAIFTYTMPVGMSLYWFVSTAFQVIQQIIMTKVMTKKAEQ